MRSHVVEAAVAAARRRAERADRDLTVAALHFDRTVDGVLDDLGLHAESWFDRGVGPPPLAVTRSDGTAAVLKLDLPGALDTEAAVMSASSGRGYVGVLAWDPVRGALLLERLGDPLWTAAPTLTAQADVIVPLLRDAWTVPLEVGRPFSGKASGLVAILADLGPRYGTEHPRAVDRASAYAAGLARDEQPEVVCHGDAHPLNVLRRGEGWALIDPDGFVGERAYDLGVLLRDGCREITAAEAADPGSGIRLLRHAANHVAQQADSDAERIWRWAFVERVTTGLYLHWHGHPQEAESFLGVADLLAP